jgi:hypothetical protein
MINKHRLTALAVAAAAIAAFALAGCSGSSLGTGSNGAAGGAAASAAAAVSAAIAGNAPAGSENVNVCQLLPAAKASQVSGTHYTGTTSTHNMCSYTGDTPDGPMFIIVFTGFQGVGDGAWKSELQTLQEDGSATPISIPGVGDRAAACGLELGAQSGSRIVDVHGGDQTGNGTTFPQSIALANALIAAMK